MSKKKKTEEEIGREHLLEIVDKAKNVFLIVKCSLVSKFSDFKYDSKEIAKLQEIVSKYIEGYDKETKKLVLGKDVNGNTVELDMNSDSLIENILKLRKITSSKEYENNGYEGDKLLSNASRALDYLEEYACICVLNKNKSYYPKLNQTIVEFTETVAKYDDMEIVKSIKELAQIDPQYAVKFDEKGEVIEGLGSWIECCKREMFRFLTLSIANKGNNKDDGIINVRNPKHGEALSVKARAVSAVTNLYEKVKERKNKENGNNRNR